LVLYILQRSFPEYDIRKRMKFWTDNKRLLILEPVLTLLVLCCWMSIFS